MAQEVEHATSMARRISIDVKSENVAVAAAADQALLDELVVSEAARVAFEIKNEGAQALDAFAVQAKFHPDGNFVTLFSAGADFTSPAGLMVDASGDLTTLASGATGWFVMDVLAIYSIRLRGSANVAGATQLDIFGRAV